MFGFNKQPAPAVVQDDPNAGFKAWVKYIEDSCNTHLEDVSNYHHPDWEAAYKEGDFRTLITMYAAACAAYEKHADKMFLEWIKGAKGVGINANKTTEFYYMVNRRFSHLAQIRCYLDYQLKLTLVPADERAKTVPGLSRILSPESSDAFFPTPAPLN